MKCTNCGFECDNLYCPMCGAKMPEQNTQQTEVNTSANIDNSTVNFDTDNLNSNPVTENPYQMPKKSDNSGYGSDFATPEYPQQNTTAYQSGYPQQNIPLHQGMPVPPQYEQKTKKQSGKVLPIVLSCIIIAVIVAGTVISVYSSYAFNKSVVDVMDEFSSEMFFSNNYDDDDSYAYATEYDDIIRKVGETSEFDDFKVTLKSTTIKDNMISDTDSQVYALEFEVENTSDTTLCFCDPYCEVYTDENKTSYYDDWESLYSDIKLDDNYDFSINSGEKAQFTLYYKFDKNVKSPLWFELVLSDIDCAKDYYITYKLDLNNSSTDATEATK